jgi:hypothetical protein
MKNEYSLKKIFNRYCTKGDPISIQTSDFITIKDVHEIVAKASIQTTNKDIVSAIAMSKMTYVHDENV